MSIKYMTAVWDSGKWEGSTLVLMLALADHANDEGICWPSVPTLAKKARLSERQTQRVLHMLAEERTVEVIEQGTGRGHRTVYCLHITKEVGGEPVPQKGDIQDTLPKTQRVTSRAVKGDIQGVKGDTAMSPPSKPSLEPPIEPSDIAAAPPAPHSRDEYEEHWKELQPQPLKHIDYGKLRKQLASWVKEQPTFEYLKGLDEYMRTKDKDQFLTDKTNYPATYCKFMDEYDRYKQRLAATNGVDPQSPKLRANRTQFDSFADYSRWAVVHDPEKKLLHEGVTIGGLLIRRNGKYLPTKGKTHDFTSIVRNDGPGMVPGVRQM